MLAECWQARFLQLSSVLRASHSVLWLTCHKSINHGSQQNLFGGASCEIVLMR